MRSCLTTWCVDAGADPEGGGGGGGGSWGVRPPLFSYKLSESRTS